MREVRKAGSKVKVEGAEAGAETEGLLVEDEGFEAEAEVMEAR